MRVSYLSSDVCSSDLEVRLTSPSDGAFRWQVGVYYLNYRRFLTSELNADTQGFLPPTRGEIDGPTAAQPTVSFGKQRYNTESFAPFASIQYDITDALHFNLAGRYRSEEHTSELQSLMRISYAVFCLKKNNKKTEKSLYN